jgi:thioredoxin-like negative regulator of GroEL
MVRVDDEMIGFDLGDCDADFARLRRIAVRIRQSNGHIDDASLSEAHALLQELGDGEFMPGFEDMEKRVTQGRGVAGQVVAEVRVQIDGTRADVADAVAKTLLDRGEPAQAVALLEPIVARSEERDDLARTLINALRESGQHKRAAEIRRRFATGQES